MKDKDWFDHESDIDAMSLTMRASGIDPTNFKEGQDMRRAAQRNAKSNIRYSIASKVTLPRLKFLEVDSK